MANHSSTQWPWTIFYTNALNYMDSLHAEICQPEIKITKFIVAARHRFASSMMNLQGSKKSTEQSKKIMENPIKSKKKGTADDRQPHQTVATSCKDRSLTPQPHGHDSTTSAKDNNKSLPMDSKTFHIDTIQLSLQDHFKCIARPSTNSHAKPSCIPVLQDKQSHLDNTLENKITSVPTDMEQTATRPPSRTCTIPPPRPSKVTNAMETSVNQWKQITQVYSNLKPVRRAPLLPTPPAPTRQHTKSTLPTPSPSYNSRKSSLPRPSMFNNNRFHQQPYIPRPHTPRFDNHWPPLLPSPPYHQQSFTPRPYPQPQGHQSPVHTTLHFIPQVSYIPVLLPHTNHVVTPVQYKYAA